MVVLCGFVFDYILVFINGKCCYVGVLLNLNGIVGCGLIVVDLNNIFILVIKCVEVFCDGVVV